ncbi:hypothetical protein K505DRAFT_80711 [Melanomma pulvis-pyrius CBS 109.77]|uniref:Secreted protein n=1 Tax=Melanomma pulvis-pyrius CBS 109.77 TaxID=1314802 RepID=A0A6A6XR79_9PLEO|nr:hypothetical protein K505DRAFT_80711 [Melanomma pulvis-pyrius CBS 109.77]
MFSFPMCFSFLLFSLVICTPSFYEAWSRPISLHFKACTSTDFKLYHRSIPIPSNTFSQGFNTLQSAFLFRESK